MTRSHEFFERHGPKTIVMARFVPIVLTFTPVIAGVSAMRYRTFLAFDVVGGIAWGAGVVLLGYFLDNVAVVKGHVELVVLLIAIASGLPSIIPVLRGALRRRN